MKIIITGGAGFIGSNFIRLLLSENPSIKIVNIDKLTYAGNLDNLNDINNHSGYSFIKADIVDTQTIEDIFAAGVDVVINFAAESHVDRSISEPQNFIRTNILGTEALLEASLKYGINKFIQISTDEVYGSLGDTGNFSENSPLEPNSPYSASKAAADLLARAYFQTYSLPVIITRSGNNYGPYQFPEKLIPLIITNLLEGKSIPIYGNGQYIREWIHVADHCRAIYSILTYGKPGEIYNIGSGYETTNLEIAKFILREMGLSSESRISFIKDRPGHDYRYAMDCTKLMREFEWKPEIDFIAGIRKTIRWYQENQSWWQKIKNGEYRNYYKKMYETQQ